MKTIRKPASYFRQFCTALSYFGIMALVCLAGFILYLIATASAHAQVPAVNSGTAVYPASGTLAANLSGTTSAVAPGLLTAGACGSGTVAVANSTTAMTVSVTPNTYPGDGVLYYGYVSANGTVTVKVCALIGLTPTSSTYNVRVIQ